jgi:hypothetical protein
VRATHAGRAAPGLRGACGWLGPSWAGALAGPLARVGGKAGLAGGWRGGLARTWAREGVLAWWGEKLGAEPPRWAERGGKGREGRGLG